MPRQLEFWEDGEFGAQEPHPAEFPIEKGLEESPVPVSGNTAPAVTPAEEGKRAGTNPSAKPADPATIEVLRVELCRLSGMNLSLKITNNSRCMMRVAHEPGGRVARLSVHWMFLDAPQAVVKALSGWVKSPRKLRNDGVLRGYMRENNDRIPAAVQRRVTISTKGTHYDLDRLYAEVNAAEFDGVITAKITWGVMLPVGRSRSGHFRLGSFNDTLNLIRIHPVLDSAQVPHFVVRSIVFHEMLHAFLGIQKEEGKRRKIHHAAFRAREERYGDHKAAEAWINNPNNLRLLAKIRRNSGG